jgi:hypothetical protein
MTRSFVPSVSSLKARKSIAVMASIAKMRRNNTIPLVDATAGHPVSTKMGQDHFLPFPDLLEYISALPTIGAGSLFKSPAMTRTQP